MLRYIADLILKNAGSRHVTSNSGKFIKDKNFYKVEFDIQDSEMLSMSIFKDGVWYLEDVETGDELLEGKVTPPSSKTWMNRLIKNGWNSEIAYASYMEWKSLKNK